MGLTDWLKDSDGYPDVEKGRAEEVDIEDWQTEYNMRTYYNNQVNQEDQILDCPDEDCNGIIVQYDSEPSRSVTDSGGVKKIFGFIRESEASRGNAHKMYSCNDYTCGNHIPGQKVRKMQEQTRSGDHPDLEADQKYKSTNEEMSQESQNASEFKSGDEEIEPPSNTETQN